VNSVSINSAMHDRAVRPDLAAQTLGISRSKLYELLDASVLPSFRIGRQRLILASDLDAYLRQLRLTAVTQAQARRGAGA